MATINDSVQYLKGVGPAFAKKFEKARHPYHPRPAFCATRANTLTPPSPTPLCQRPMTPTAACAPPCCRRSRPAASSPAGRVMSRVLAADDSGILTLTWFNAAYAADNLTVGGELLL